MHTSIADFFCGKELKGYGKESIFSDLNNLKVVTTTSDEYATSFGFTEKEVFAALEEYGYSDEKEAVKQWYDGFTFQFDWKAGTGRESESQNGF